MGKNCIKCGKEMNEGETVCSQCGAAVEGNTTNVATPKKSNGFAIAALIISIVSLLLCCGSLSWLSLIFSIVGIATAKNLEGKGKGMSIASTIISILGLILLIVSVVVAPMLGWFSVRDFVNNQWEDDQWANISIYNADDYDYDYDFDYDS